MCACKLQCGHCDIQEGAVCGLLSGWMVCAAAGCSRCSPPRRSTAPTAVSCCISASREATSSCCGTTITGCCCGILLYACTRSS
jgi:hypothetical protein